MSKQNKKCFQHLSESVKVVSKKKSNGLIGGVVAVSVLVLIVVVMLSGHSKKPMQKPIENNVVMNDAVLQKNAKKLVALEQQQTKTTPTSIAPVMQFSTPKETKALRIRRNAPTQMFTATTPAAYRASTEDKTKSDTMIGEGAFARFANHQNSTVTTVRARQIAHPRYTITEGELIHATLETAIQSDLPGRVRAIITAPIYAYEGEQPLIPAGSRLIGQYTTVTSNGAASTRLFIIWHRVITPKGLSILINSPGADALGRAGMGADATDRHFFKIFGNASLLSILGATTASLGVSGDEQANSANQYRQSIASAFQQAGQSSLSHNLSIKPTLHIHQGDRINAFVAKDLDFYSVLGNHS